jgi:hypothetical protein
VHINGPLNAAAVTQLRNALIAAGGAGTITTIQIGTDVTSIANNALNGETTLTSLTFKDAANSQCVSIGALAFNGCTSLTGTLTIPAHVTSIGYEAFTSATPNTLTFTAGGSGLTIGDNAFDSATMSGQSLTIPARVTSIGNGAFASAGPTSVTFSTSKTLLTTTTGVQPFPVATSLSDTLGLLLSNFGAASSGYTTIDRNIGDVTFS